MYIINIIILSSTINIKLILTKKTSRETSTYNNEYRKLPLCFVAHKKKRSKYCFCFINFLFIFLLLYIYNFFFASLFIVLANVYCEMTGI